MRPSVIFLLKLLIHSIAIGLVGLMFWDYFHGRLTANPIEEITKRTGTYALVTLVFTLSCTPVRILSGFNQVTKARRLLGLYSFFFATLHFLTFIGLDYAFDLELIAKDVVKKRYVIAGFSVYLMLMLLAVTSFQYMQRKLGRHWPYIHALIYPAAALAVLHFVWQMKADIRKPALYGLFIFFLLILRLPFVKNKLSRKNFLLKIL